MEIGERIKEIRKEKEMTLKQLADKLGSSPQLISQYESGKRKPKIETIEKISAAFNMSLEKFMKWDILEKEICQSNERKLNAIDGIKSVLLHIYGDVEEKHICYKDDDVSYFLVGNKENCFILHHDSLNKLLKYADSSFPLLVDELKDDRPEEIVKNEILNRMKRLNNLLSTK